MQKQGFSRETILRILQLSEQSQSTLIVELEELFAQNQKFAFDEGVASVQNQEEEEQEEEEQKPDEGPSPKLKKK